MDKKEQRSSALKARKILSNTQKLNNSQRLCERLLSVPGVLEARNIFAFAAMKDEVDLSFFAEKAKRERGAIVSYPVSYKGGIMKAFAPSDDSAWETGLMGIRTPIEDMSQLIMPEEIDLVLVPCVGFDEQCRRIGYGGGYYDRYLPQCKNASFVCVAFEAQKLYNIATEDHDVPMGCIVTEDRIYWPE